MNTLRNIAAFVAAFLVGSLNHVGALRELHMTIWVQKKRCCGQYGQHGGIPRLDGPISMPTVIAATVVHWLGTAAGVAVGIEGSCAVRSHGAARHVAGPTSWAPGLKTFLGGHCQRHSVGHAHCACDGTSRSDSHRRFGVPVWH